MAKLFFSGGKKAASVLGALTAAMLLLTSCSTETVNSDPNNAIDDKVLEPTGGPILPEIPVPFVDVPPPAVIPVEAWDSIMLMVRSDPAHPQNENFLDDWRFQLFNIDDQARPTSPVWHAESGPDGTALVGLPAYMFALPLVINAYNDSYPLVYVTEEVVDDVEEGFIGECLHFEIFVPPYCFDKALWLLGPFENSLWHYYKRAAKHRGEAWNPSQVDCATWLANMQLLIMTDRITDELEDFPRRETPAGLSYPTFRQEALIDAIQKNQQFLTPTRPPICMAERRHNGGGMERITFDDAPLTNPPIVSSTVNLDNFVLPYKEFSANPDEDPVIIDLFTGTVESICDTFTGVLWNSEGLEVNGVPFTPIRSFYLDDENFMGAISEQPDVVASISVEVFNTKLGNGYNVAHAVYDDVCSMTSMIKFTNRSDDERDLHHTNTGVTFANLFGDSINTTVFMTSDGDQVVDGVDTWVIFYRSDGVEGEELVLTAELLGIREEDFRDELHIVFEPTSENLFLGLRADYELNEEAIDGEQAFLAYTLTVWDGSTDFGRNAVRRNIADCYEASDVWAREFFVTRDFERRRHECCNTDEHCFVRDLITSLEAAEFAVRSQCFSNSRANQRWRNDDSGFWSINSDHGVESNIIVNAGWLAPYLDFQIYIQKFDEAVFKGPRTIVTSDAIGQILVDMPTLVEGDRVLIKSDESCCDDYDLVLPCVPEFTGFAGAPGIPYIPVTLGPPPLPPVPDPGIMLPPPPPPPLQ